MLPDAVALMEAAEQRMGGGDVSVNSEDVLRLADASGCTAYDSEFVAAAQQLGATLVTADRKILAAFPAVSMSIADFAAA